MIEVEKVIENNCFDLRDKLGNYFKNISIKSKELITQSKKISNEFPFKPIDEKFIEPVNKYFGSDIGKDLYLDIISSYGNLNAFKQYYGFLGYFKFLGYKFRKDYYYYLWYVIDLFKRSYQDKVNGVCNFFYYVIKDDLNRVIKQMGLNEKKMSTTFQGEKTY